MTVNIRIDVDDNEIRTLTGILAEIIGELSTVNNPVERNTSISGARVDHDWSLHITQDFEE
jgi:hypothetical protein